MQVSFNPSVKYKPNFTASVLKTPTEVERYLTSLAKKSKLEASDVLDLTETIRQTKDSGKSVITSVLIAGAKELGFIK